VHYFCFVLHVSTSETKLRQLVFLDLYFSFISSTDSARFDHSVTDRARQLYKNISMLFLFPVKDGKLSTGVIAIYNASCYG